MDYYVINKQILLIWKDMIAPYLLSTKIGIKGLIMVNDDKFLVIRYPEEIGITTLLWKGTIRIIDPEIKH